MKNILILLILLVGITTPTLGQKIVFRSKNFEAAVKHSLGIEDNAEITQASAAAVSALDLSGNDLRDISDISFFSNLVTLNLSGNRIENVEPLRNLANLQQLDLSKNEIESIEPLCLSTSNSLNVNVSGNYIRYFAGFSSAPYCVFNVIGTKDQKDKKSYELSVNQFFCSVSDIGKTLLTYALWSNQPKVSLQIIVGRKQVVPAVVTNYSQELDISPAFVKYPQQDTEIELRSNGKMFGKTILVVPRYFIVKKNVGQQELPLKLPEGYKVDFLCNTSKIGRIALQNGGLTYNLSHPNDLVADTIRYGYSDPNGFRGFSYFVVLSTTPYRLEIEQPANGSLIVKNKANGKLILPGSMVPNGTKLEVSIIPRNGYAPDCILVNEKQLAPGVEVVMDKDLKVSARMRQVVGVTTVENKPLQMNLMWRKRLFEIDLNINLGEEVIIRDSNGGVCYKILVLDTKQSIDVSELPSGIYLISTRNVTRKVLIR